MGYKILTFKALHALNIRKLINICYSFGGGESNMSYKLFKELHRENIVLLIKEGNFYSAYQEDAYVLNYLLSFKIIYSSNFTKVSFPKDSLSKVKNILELRKCDFSVSDNNMIITSCSNDNNYQKYLNQEKYLKDKLLYSLSKLSYEELLSITHDSFKV